MSVVSNYDSLRIHLYSLTLVVVCLMIQGELLAAGDAIVVGSKKFNESVILGEIAVILVEDTGTAVIHRRQLGGTQILWQAMQRGDIDCYVEYTGTITEEILPSLGINVQSEKNEMKSIGYLKEQLAIHDVIVSNPLGFNNTYALGMTQANAQKLEVNKISHLRAHAQLRVGISEEFRNRRDGWDQLASRYQLPQMRIQTIDHDLAYQGLQSDFIQITDLYTTDPEIREHGLVTLEDDLKFFPDYEAVLLIRSDVQDRNPLALAALHRMEKSISQEQMIALSASVKFGNLTEIQAAKAFVNRAFNIGEDITRTDSLQTRNVFWARLLQTTQEHLVMVSISMLMAILISIPLGIVGQSNLRLGTTIVGVVSVLQTMPSLALLVLMIPLFGLGALPAIVALFFYSLLPIVRNTLVGLKQIDSRLLESADVLGLNRFQRLRLIELPLAMPSILAGIKTATVINIGTATIGALIGAGGYGSPILTGIRLNNFSLVLQGAIPAALMALLAQAFFVAVERRIISPGLLDVREER